MTHGVIDKIRHSDVAGEMPQNLPALIGASMASGIAGLSVAELVESLTNTRLVVGVGTGLGTPQRWPLLIATKTVTD